MKETISGKLWEKLTARSIADVMNMFQAAPEEKKLKTEDVSKVLHDVQDMKGKQDEMTVKLDQIKRLVSQKLHEVVIMLF